MTIFSKTDLRGYANILLAGLVAAMLVNFKYRHDLGAARARFVTEERAKSREVASRIEDAFHTVYQGLRIISRLPGVRDVRRDGRRFDPNASLAVQEIYESIADRKILSEVYVVPADFDPAKIDPATGRGQEPLLIFDEKISDELQEGPQALYEDDDTYEYRLVALQMKWFSQWEPFEREGAASALTGPEVLTCDYTRYDEATPDERDRMGLAYTVPFYDQSSRLKGGVTGILLSNQLADLLPSGDYAVVNRRFGYRLSRRGSTVFDGHGRYVDALKPDPSLLYSEAIPLEIPDSDNPWYLWAHRENAVFWKRGDVAAARQLALLGWTGSFLLTAGMSIGYFFARTHGRRLERANQRLVHQQTLLEHSRDVIKRFSGRVLSAREEEMKRVGRDLHDAVGAIAVSLNAKLALAEAEIRALRLQTALRSVRDTRGLVDGIVQDLKRIAVSLRPPQLETAGLAGALAEICAQVEEASGLRVRFEGPVEEPPLPSGESIALYRIVQESLTNTVKHASASEVLVRLEYSPGRVQVSVRDDGRGFSNPRPADDGRFRMGLLGMRERAESFGGIFRVDSRPGGGTTVTVAMPAPLSQKLEVK